MKLESYGIRRIPLKWSRSANQALYYSSWLNERSLAACIKPTSNATLTVFEMHAVFLRNADLEKNYYKCAFESNISLKMVYKLSRK